MPLASPSIVAAVAAGLLQWGVVVWALHAPLRRAMRERGLPSWRVRDTLSTSPLFAAGTLAVAIALSAAVARVAGGAGAGSAGALLAVAGGGAVVAAFGIRAVGKLF